MHGRVVCVHNRESWSAWVGKSGGSAGSATMVTTSTGDDKSSGPIATAGIVRGVGRFTVALVSLGKLNRTVLFSMMEASGLGVATSLCR